MVHILYLVDRLLLNLPDYAVLKDLIKVSKSLPGAAVVASGGGAAVTGDSVSSVLL